MKDVQIYGRFVNEMGEPIEGFCKFEPSRIWVEEGDEAFPVPAPFVVLDEGRVLIDLIRTDQHGGDWYYTVTCPVGAFATRIEEDGPLLLRDLMAQYA